MNTLFWSLVIFIAMIIGANLHPEGMFLALILCLAVPMLVMGLAVACSDMVPVARIVGGLFLLLPGLALLLLFFSIL